MDPAEAAQWTVHRGSDVWSEASGMEKANLLNGSCHHSASAWLGEQLQKVGGIQVEFKWLGFNL